ncbi:hypothetical protein VB737_12735 [Synechococcus sp. BA-120 BA3]|nr:hypothetical protein [Synechococcus sp. BA-120 BA3]
MRHHVVITGTGRSGTTFLVELLTRLRLDTGWDVENIKETSSSQPLRPGMLQSQADVLDKGFVYPSWDPIARAGLEKSIFDPAAPYIVKSPGISNFIAKVLADDRIQLDHVFIPIRDLQAAAESRRMVVRINEQNLSFKNRIKSLFKRNARFNRYAGGLTRTSSLKPGAQEQSLCLQIYELMLNLAACDVPVTFIRYPTLTADAKYLYRKLAPILAGISEDVFTSVFSETVRPELVHTFNKNDV